MKLQLLATSALLLGLSTIAQANAVYSPEQGIICDKKSGFCVDSEGISLGYTKEYLGQAAQDKWDKMIQRDHMDTSSYTMSNGLHCESSKKICKKNKWDEKADAHWTKILFGSSVVKESSGSADKMMPYVKEDCVNYIAKKFSIPTRAVNASNGKKHGESYSIPIYLKLDEPRLDEKGVCKYIDGDDITYTSN